MVTMQRVNAGMPQRIARDNLATALNDEIAQYYQTEIARNQDQRQANLEPYLLEQANLNNQKALIDVFNNSDELNARKSIDAILASGATPTADNYQQYAKNVDELNVLKDLVSGNQKVTSDQQKITTDQYAIDEANKYRDAMIALTGKTPAENDAAYLYNLRNGVGIPRSVNTSSRIASNQRSYVPSSNPTNEATNAPSEAVNALNQVLGNDAPAYYDRATEQPINLPGGYAKTDIFQNYIPPQDNGTQKGFGSFLKGLSDDKQIQLVSENTPNAIAVYTSLDGGVFTAKVGDKDSYDRLKAIQLADKATLSNKSQPKEILDSYSKTADPQIKYVTPESLPSIVENSPSRNILTIDKDTSNFISITRNDKDQGYNSNKTSVMSEKDMRELDSKIETMQNDPNVNTNYHNADTLKSYMNSLARPTIDGLNTLLNNPAMSANKGELKQELLSGIRTGEGATRFKLLQEIFGPTLFKNLSDDDAKTLVKFIQDGKDAGTGLNSMTTRLLRRDTTNEVQTLLSKMDAYTNIKDLAPTFVKQIDTRLPNLPKNSQEYKELSKIREDLIANKIPYPVTSGDILNGNIEQGARSKQAGYIYLDKNDKATFGMGKEIQGNTPISIFEYNPIVRQLVDNYVRDNMTNDRYKNLYFPSKDEIVRQLMQSPNVNDRDILDDILGNRD
jgi:hypothetical protein|nr:MAG TPA: hypothetical protein [Caudoviricetes sp.]